MSDRRHSLALTLGMALAVAPAPGAAQNPAFAGRPVSPAASMSPSAARADSANPVELTLSSVSASGAPRSYQVVSIPVPEALAQAPEIRIEIIPRGDFTVLGARSRILVASAAGQRKNRVAVTIGIPAKALAGQLLAAEARFSAAGSVTFVVPVEIDVSLVRELALRPPATILGQAGSEIVVPLEIVNAGNARDTVDAAIALPSGWVTRGSPHLAIAIEPATTVKRRVRISIPALSSTGSSFVRIDLTKGDETLASSTITVEVFNSGSIQRTAGPQVISAISHATDENGRPNRAVSLSAHGALFDSVRVDARVSHTSSLGAGASNVFARLGTFNSPPSITLTAPSGQLSLGNTGTSFSELTGLYPYGQGGLLHLRQPGWDLLTFGALSMQHAGVGRRQPMLGVRGERQVGELRLSSSLSHLADGGPSPRSLDAIGVGAAIPSLFRTTLKLEVAERRFASGRGLGWSSEIVRASEGGSEHLRVTHAPGGSDAFARATNEILANFSERLSSRAAVTASAWRTADATAVFSGLASSGYSLRPQYDVRPGTTVAIEGRTYVFDATSRVTALNAGGGFGTRESQLGLTFNSRIRQFHVNTSAFLGNVLRTVTPATGVLVRDRAPRNYWATSAGWAGLGGGFEVQTRIEQTRDRGGAVNQQNVYGIRGDHVVLPWLGGIRAEGELQRVHGFASDKSSMMRFGTAVPVMRGVAIRFDAERNSIFRHVDGSTPWVFGARIEHALTLPMIRTPGTTGHVYQDTNGNQRRDRGEPGVEGAILRRGAETAVTDADGRYRIGGDRRQQVVIDEASLPEGWSGNGGTRSDIGVLLSVSAKVELIVAPRSGFAPVKVDLSKARIIARDPVGREWSARMAGPSTATFDALPRGTYTLEFDLSELSEPLVARAPLPPLVVGAGEAASLTIILDLRPVRMWQAPVKNGGQSGSPPSPASK